MWWITIYNQDTKNGEALLKLAKIRRCLVILYYTKNLIIRHIGLLMIKFQFIISLKTIRSSAMLN